METNARLRILILIIITIRYITCCAGQEDLNDAQDEAKVVAEESAFEYKIKPKEAFKEKVNACKMRENILSNLLCPHKTVDIDGDIILGGIMSIHDAGHEQMCGPLMPNRSSILELEAILYTIDKVNSDTDFLPGIKLGAHILDDCYQESYSLLQAINFIPGTRNAFETFAFQCPDGKPNFHSPKVAGVIRSEMSCCRVARLLDKFKMPQVIFSDTSFDFIKKPKLEYLLKTVPSSKKTAEMMFNLVLFSHLSGFSDNENDFLSLMGMEKNFSRKNISIPLNQPIGNDSSATCDGYYDKVVEMLREESKDKTAVIVGSQAEIDGINVKISFGITNSLSIAIHDRIKYIVKFITPPVAGFEDYFKYLNVKNNKRNPWFAEYWEQTFSCKLPETKQTPWNKFDKVCNGNEKLSTVDRLQIEETIKHASDSVMAFAYAIKAMHSDLCDDEPGVCDAMKPLNRTMLLKNLKNVSFKGLDGVNFEFKKRDEPSRIKIFLLNEKDPKICEYVSGSYYENMTFVSLSENFNFEGYEHPHPCISLNRMIKRKMALSELEIFIGLLMLVPIVIFLVIGLLKCIGIIKKVQKTDGELSCELSGVSLETIGEATTVVIKEVNFRDTSIPQDSMIV